MNFNHQSPQQKTLLLKATQSFYQHYLKASAYPNDMQNQVYAKVVQESLPDQVHLIDLKDLTYSYLPAISYDNNEFKYPEPILKIFDQKLIEFIGHYFKL